MMMNFLRATIPNDLDRLRDAEGIDWHRLREAVEPEIERAEATPALTAGVLINQRARDLGAVRAWLLGERRVATLQRRWKDDLRHTWFGRRLVYRDAIAYLDLMRLAIDNAPRSAEGALRFAERLKALEVDPDHTFTSVERSHLGLAFRNEAVTLASLRLALVALVLLERRQLDGDWPATLPADLPQDPFTGRAFDYERTEGGIRIRCAWMRDPWKLE